MLQRADGHSRGRGGESAAAPWCDRQPLERDPNVRTVHLVAQSTTLSAARPPVSPEVAEALLHSHFEHIRSFALGIAGAEIAIIAITFALMLLPVQRASEYGASGLLRFHLTDWRTIAIYSVLSVVAVLTSCMAAYGPMSIPPAYCKPAVIGGLVVALALMYVHFMHVVFALDLHHYIGGLVGRGRRHLARYRREVIEATYFARSLDLGPLRADLSDEQGMRYIVAEKAHPVLQSGVPSPLEFAGDELSRLVELAQALIAQGRSEYASRCIGALSDLTSQSLRMGRLERVVDGERHVYGAPVRADLDFVLERCARWNSMTIAQRDDQAGFAVRFWLARLLIAASIAERGSEEQVWMGESLVRATTRSAVAALQECATDRVAGQQICESLQNALPVVCGSGHVRAGRDIVSALIGVGARAIRERDPGLSSTVVRTLCSCVRTNLAEPTPTLVASVGLMTAGLRLVLAGLLHAEFAAEVNDELGLREYLGQNLFVGFGSPQVETLTWAVDRLGGEDTATPQEVASLNEVVRQCMRFYKGLGERAARVDSLLAPMIASDLAQLLGVVQGFMSSPRREVVEDLGRRTVDCLRGQLVSEGEWMRGNGDDALEALTQRGMWFGRDGWLDMYWRCQEALRATWQARDQKDSGAGDSRKGTVLDRVVLLEVVARIAGIDPNGQAARINWIRERGGRTEGAFAAIEVYLDPYGAETDRIGVPASFPVNGWRQRTQEVLSELRGAATGNRG